MTDIHIASCVVHARPDRVAEIERTIRAQQLAEVAAVDERGRIVVVMEGRGAGPIVAAIEQLRALPGVVAVNLVYQHAEDEQALEEPLS